MCDIPAVRNPVGKVKADIQKTFGGWSVEAHFVNISILWTKSRVQDANGFDEGYASEGAEEMEQIDPIDDMVSENGMKFTRQ